MRVVAIARLSAIIALGACFLPGCTNPRATSEPPGLPLDEVELSLRPLAEPLAPAQPGDWLVVHKEEGQSFAQYMKLRPKRAGKYTVIYLLLLGEFTSAQRDVLAIT